MGYMDCGFEERRFDEILASKQKQIAQNNEWKPLARAGEIGKDLVQLLREIGAIVPEKHEQKTIARLLSSESDIAFFSVVCPDYSTEEEKGVVRYTFDSLGEGVGVVANRALEVHLRLAKFFTERHTMVRNISFVLAMADQEANDQNCQRVKLDRQEFLARLRRSQELLENQASKLGIKIETPFLTEMDPTHWETSQQEAKKLLGQVSPGLLGSVRRARQPLYERWTGQLLKEEQAMAMLLVQVEEYIAVGRYLSSPNGVIIGLDPPVMANFIRHGANGTPVIYFKRPDY